MCARIIAWHGQVHIFDAEQFLVSAVHWKKNNKEAAVDVPLVEDLWPRKPLIPTTLILPSAQIPQLIDAHDDDGHHGPGDLLDDLANMELWMVCTNGAQVGAPAQVGVHAQVGGDKCPRFFISGGLFIEHPPPLCRERLT